ncbi:hypothetical protein C8J57DRAFT_1471506 [Mycena rebaudengoi]|nr:hypothetical protein C8J57DRAFT_1471506 [Mycena rebaudengoi]
MYTESESPRQLGQKVRPPLPLPILLLALFFPFRTLIPTGWTEAGGEAYEGARVVWWGLVLIGRLVRGGEEVSVVEKCGDRGGVGGRRREEKRRGGAVAGVDGKGEAQGRAKGLRKGISPAPGAATVLGARGPQRLGDKERVPHARWERARRARWRCVPVVFRMRRDRAVMVDPGGTRASDRGITTMCGGVRRAMPWMGLRTYSNVESRCIETGDWGRAIAESACGSHAACGARHEGLPAFGRLPRREKSRVGSLDGKAYTTTMDVRRRGPAGTIGRSTGGGPVNRVEMRGGLVVIAFIFPPALERYSSIQVEGTFKDGRKAGRRGVHVGFW